MASPTSQKPLRSDRHYVALDGLRGLAVLMVFFVHYGDLTKSPSTVMRLVAFVKGAGWMGVDLFFVLSGFLITGILFDTASDRHYFKNFYMRRVLRLFPVFYGTAVVLLILTPFLHIPWRWMHLGYLFYGANFIQIADPQVALPGPFVLMHLWSLALEEQFYFIWPLVVLLVRDRTRLFQISLAMIIVAPLVRLAFLWFHIPGVVIYTQLPTRMDGFATGAALALLLRHVSVDTLVRKSRAILVVCAAVIIAAGIRAGTFDYRGPWMIAVGYSALAFLFVALLVLALDVNTWTHRIFSMRIFRFYGSISYGFYVFHELVHNLTRPIYLLFLARVPSSSIAGVLYIFSVLGLVTAISYLSFKYFEIPFLRLKNRFQYHSRSEAPAEVPAVSS